MKHNTELQLRVQPFGLARDEVLPLEFDVLLLVLFVSHSSFAAGVDCCFRVGGEGLAARDLWLALSLCFPCRAIGASELRSSRCARAAAIFGSRSTAAGSELVSMTSEDMVETAEVSTSVRSSMSDED